MGLGFAKLSFMAHSAWKGTISFGLVNIPISLQTMETGDKIHFHMLDKKDMSPIKYKTTNGNTTKEVSRSQIVKGFEYKKNDYVIITDEDFKKANVKATKTIEIQAFIEQEEIAPTFFVRPYFIEPEGKAEKSYMLLRETLKKTGKIGIAKIVMQGKQHLCAVIASDEHMILEILRFAHELKKPVSKGLPRSNVKKLGLKDSELKMAETLVNQMVEKWKPEQYHDEYQEDLRKFITDKVKKGKHAKGKEIEDAEVESDDADEGKVVDFMSLLKKSVEKKGRGKSA